MSKIFKFLAAAMIAMFAVGSLTACSTAEPIDMATVAAVIDVRTPEEVAAGHLDGSLHIDIQGSDFASQMNQLDKSANYVIYCRSGNRAGAAIDWMTENGFTGTLTNAGSLADAAIATGMEITQ
jgi:rhodanese-related sulfurtransferase